MKKKSTSLTNIDESIDFYKQRIKNIPILSKDEEYNLAKKFKEKNDIQAAKKLIELNINYVIKIAKNYSGYGINIKDLIQEGIIGLMKAVNNFNPDKKYRLISFAIYWIKSEIHAYIIKNLRIVKIASTKKQKKLFFNLKNIKKIGWLNNKEKSPIINLLNTKTKELEYMERRLNSKDIKTEYHNDDIKHTDESQIELDKYAYEINKENDPLIITEKNNLKQINKKKLNKALYKLDKRSLDIIKNRWLNENTQTLKSLADIYNISSERVRQIENNAIKKLKFLIESEK
ncbi:RNA polymerase factor sigma-32 [Candidatus Azoamicus ciliaticola]|uniref:RNA polymerase sigma factor RpoH n=1 Tax=Candidatus Azoamicus ciliaticola TaxID=2652803 RepID=A0A6J5JW05_9GAMM|nr:RNA polymerase factor sigma-32 [Candidatus Azoamicus ciliaticola]CAB3976498.1 RNA polymerase sigma factor RpoH [Candidatus Azoamicus ciliaticola]